MAGQVKPIAYQGVKELGARLAPSTQAWSLGAPGWGDSIRWEDVAAFGAQSTPLGWEVFSAAFAGDDIAYRRVEIWLYLRAIDLSIQEGWRERRPQDEDERKDFLREMVRTAMREIRNQNLFESEEARRAHFGVESSRWWRLWRMRYRRIQMLLDAELMPVLERLREQRYARAG